MDLRCEAGQVERLFECRVTAADNGDLAIPEEEAVAGRAGRHATPAKTSLAFEVQPQRRSPRRDDDRFRAVFDAAGPDAERPTREVDVIDVDVDDLRAEPLGLVAHGCHEVRALDSLGKTGIVFDVTGQHQLATGRGTGKDDRLEVGAGGIDRRREPGRARTNDHQLRLDGTA